MKRLATFIVDGRSLGVDVARVREVLRPHELTRVPLAPPQIAGLINIRGELIEVGGYALTSSGSSGSRRRAILWTGVLPCYANCDGSTSAPVLNVLDFTCFLQKFAAGCP